MLSEISSVVNIYLAFFTFIIQNFPAWFSAQLSGFQFPLSTLCSRIKGIFIVSYSPACKEDLLYPSDTLTDFRNPELPIARDHLASYRVLQGPLQCMSCSLWLIARFPTSALSLEQRSHWQRWQSQIRVLRSVKLCQGGKNKVSSFPLYVLLLTSFKFELFIANITFKA